MKTIATFFNKTKNRADKIFISAQSKMRELAASKHSGIDGVIVVVGLCIIALVIIFLLKDKLAAFVSQITENMQNKATTVLDGASMNVTP